MSSAVDLNRLQIFREVVLAGSFSKAAIKLHQPKSRISRHIAALEQELGVQLIYRTTRQFQLTQSGQDLFHKTSPLLNELTSTLERVSLESDEIAGPIRLTVPDDIGGSIMGDICHQFMQLHPKVQMTLYASNQYVDLIKESIDIAVRIGKSKDSTMIRKRVGSVELVLVASPELLKRFGPITRTGDLERLPYLGFTTPLSATHSLKLSNGKETRTVKLRSSFAANNFFVLRDMAIRGAGCALVPSFLAREALAENSLVHILKEWRTEQNPVQILIPHQKETPERIRKFIQFATDSLTAYL